MREERIQTNTDYSLSEHGQFIIQVKADPALSPFLCYNETAQA